jgi:UrcA family protein
MTRTVTLCLRRTALAALALTSWSLAASAADTITVNTVRPTTDVTDENPATAAITMQYELQLLVNYADLDLATSTGATALRERVDQAARMGCRALDRARPFVGADLDCPRLAVREAEPQVAAAIAAATP